MRMFASVFPPLFLRVPFPRCVLQKAFCLFARRTNHRTSGTMIFAPSFTLAPCASRLWLGPVVVQVPLRPASQTERRRHSTCIPTSKIRLLALRKPCCCHLTPSFIRCIILTYHWTDNPGSTAIQPNSCFRRLFFVIIRSFVDFRLLLFLPTGLLSLLR